MSFIIWLVRRWLLLLHDRSRRPVGNIWSAWNSLTELTRSAIIASRSRRIILWVNIWKLWLVQGMIPVKISYLHRRIIAQRRSVVNGLTMICMMRIFCAAWDKCCRSRTHDQSISKINFIFQNISKTAVMNSIGFLIHGNSGLSSVPKKNR